jgi:protoheme IX farnesyltransferase
MITERPVQGRASGVLERTAQASSPATRRNPIAVVRAYLSLTKPQIVELLLVTTVPALMLAAGGWPDLRTLAVVLVGGALAGGAASALNCYIDRDIDELMRRTKRRPLPAHSVTPRAVLIFGLTLSVVSVR